MFENLKKPCLHDYICIRLFCVAAYLRCTSIQINVGLVRAVDRQECQKFTFNLEKQKHVLRKCFCPPHASNRIHVIPKKFTNFCKSWQFTKSMNCYISRESSLIEKLRPKKAWWSWCFFLVKWLTVQYLWRSFLLFFSICR